MKVKNSGERDGLEVVQLYVKDMNPKIFKAAKELKAFKKIMVPAGKEIALNMEVAVSGLAYFDEGLMQWNISPGNYKLLAGTSSRNIQASCEISIQ